MKALDTLVAAKTKEIDALTASIEDKTTAIGELGVQIVQMKGTFLSLRRASSKLHSEELLALADTIKMFNDDDALEFVKKTLPGSSASFMQLQVSAASLRSQALALLEAGKNDKKGDRQRIDYIMLAICGKNFGFDKVLNQGEWRGQRSASCVPRSSSRSQTPSRCATMAIRWSFSRRLSQA